MISFSTPQLSDRQWVTEKYRQSNFDGCDGSFVNLYAWNHDNGGIALVEGFLVQFLEWEGRRYYTYPAGTGDPTAAILALAKDAAERNIPLLLNNVDETRRQQLNAIFPGKFSFTENRDMFEYIYPIRQLAELTGKKLQSKRNHCNRFEAEHDWHIEAISKENLPAVQQFAEDWYQDYDDSTDDIYKEHLALTAALNHYFQLEMEGIVLYSSEKVIAFTAGSPLNDRVFNINFEKAYADIRGAYSMINREFARYILAKYPHLTHLNREEDMGVPGLRKAKESYLPETLLVKAVARLEETL